MSEMKECKKCHKLFSRLTSDENICYFCHMEKYPMCQHPGCNTRCDHTKDLLCEYHYKKFTSGNLQPELQSFFENKFQQQGIPFVIIKRG